VQEPSIQEGIAHGVKKEDLVVVQGSPARHRNLKYAKAPAVRERDPLSRLGVEGSITPTRARRSLPAFSSANIPTTHSKVARSTTYPSPAVPNT
jgi:hypothetical protein